MKYILPAIVFAGLTLSATGQSKLNGPATLLIDNIELTSQSGVMRAQALQKKVDVLVLIDGSLDAAAIEDLGGVVQWQTNDIVAVNVPIASLEALSELSFVKFVEYQPEMRAMLDYARPSGKVDQAQNGFQFNGTNHSFTGKGVLTGLMDQGIEPNHINFFDEDGESRVEAVYHFASGGATPIEYIGADEVSYFTTDDSSVETAGHGTHVAGIMAGCYKGEGIYARVTSPTGGIANTVTGNIPYYGVATESRIAMACGPFSNNAVGGAVKYLCNLAEEMGMPAVVNLSLGSNYGPHDGSDLLSKAVSEQSKRAIICVSSGNEGEDAMFVGHKFTAAEPEVKTFVTGNKASGTIEIWGKDNNPFKVSVMLYANSGGSLTEVFSLDAAGKANSTSSNLFRTNFNGSISATSNVNALNRRYNVSLSMSGVSQSKSGYALAIVIEGSEGQEIWMYGCGANQTTITFTSNSRPGWTNGSCAGTINSLACAEGVIAIGSYNSRTKWGRLNSSGTLYYSSTSQVDEISDFSSWGTTFQGVQLPIVCAPGSVLVSSINTYMIDAGGSRNYPPSAEVENPHTGMTNYWAGMQGTSMSSPFAAGTVALWLEAAPSLTVNEVIDIIKKTSVPVDCGDEEIGDYDYELAARWGAGKLDAVAGLKEVLSNYASINDIFADDADKALILTPIDGGYKAFVAGEDALKASLIDMQGRVVAEYAADGSEVVVSTASVTPGVYALSINGARATYTRKVAVK